MQLETRPPAVVVSGLTKSYGDIEAVRGIDFEVAAGETFGFLGPNGAGKSTTIKILCTLARPTSGRASVAGHDVASERDAVRRNIGLVFQDTTLDNYLTGAQNLRFHAELYAVPSAAVAPRMKQVLDMVGLWDRRDSLVSTYSGGMQRRLEIARGLLHAPHVLFLDEPTVGLDPQTRSSIWEYINDLKTPGRHHDLPDHALHGRGRALRPDRDHRPREDRGDRHAGGAQGQRGQGPGADPDRRRRRRDQGAGRRVRPRGRHPRGSGDVLGRSRASSSCRSCSPRLTVPIRSVSVSRPSLDDVFMSYTGTTIRDAEASGTDHMRQMAQRIRGRR